MRDFDGGGAVEKEIMEIIEKKLSEIRPYENNPRKNDDAVEYVANSIREFGWKVPIVIDRDGVIIAGHTRYKAAQKLGYETVPCIMADDLTPEQVKAYRLADNKVSELAGWDFEMLDAELEDIDLDMEAFGFEIPTNVDVDSFFDRGVETKEKEAVFGVKVICGTEQQRDELMAQLEEQGYAPKVL